MIILTKLIILQILFIIVIIIPKQIYKLPKDDDINLVIISFDPLKLMANEMKIAITDFNQQSYSSDKFTVNVTF